MYSPSSLFQLQALQSLAPGKDHTHFNLNVLLRASFSPAKIPLSAPDKNWEATESFCFQKDIAPLLNLYFRLLANSKCLNDGTVLGNIFLFQVLQKPSPLADELQ
jgi:hypothetical protein